MGGRNRNKRNEAVHALVYFWITNEGKLSLRDLMIRLQSHNKRFSNSQSLAQALRPLVTNKKLMRVSEYPNPEYDLHR
jgi:hypothetical protein